jgi:hypothetical protein
MPPGMTKRVTMWRCKCGVRVKVVTEMDIEDPTTTVIIKCPLCGDAQVISADQLVALNTENDDLSF